MMTIRHNLDAHVEIARLKGELPVHCEVKTERGGPRLFVNGEETYPLVAWSWGLVHSAPFFKRAGIKILQPVLGLNAAWERCDVYDFSEYDNVFAHVLREHPDVFFLPRVLLDVPDWWRDQYPDELVKLAKPLPEGRNPFRPIRRNAEGGWLWGLQVREPSLASRVWREDMTVLLTALLTHVKNSPLSSRVLGYQIGAGIYGEWHYFVSAYAPDMSAPMKQKVGYVPDLHARLHTSFGLFRDPEKERAVMDYFHRFHTDVCAEALLHFARVAKQATDGRVIIGAFYGYLLENVWIQDGGHLAPEKVLNCADIDFFASPYAYQRTNIPGRLPWEHDIVDGVGNDLGRARGVAGDGGYRVLWESLRRHGKLYFAELDSNTYLEPPPMKPDGSGGTDVEKELCMLGGEGTTTREGTFRILQRDLGQVFVKGNGGWVFDFGPVLRTKKSWYADDSLTALVRDFVLLGDKRRDLDMGSVSQIAAVYDAKSLFATRYWLAEHPFRQGAGSCDFFTTWFLDSQSRSLHRIGAPVDFLYRFDLQTSDVGQYKLFLMVNVFYLTADEVNRLLFLFSGSGVTVVWVYAPGFVSDKKIDLTQMERLTGFRFDVMTDPGPMVIEANLPNDGSVCFGVTDVRSPRFAVLDGEPIGHWVDGGTAFARKVVDGWTSVYVGTAPLPQRVLRWLSNQAGALLWSDQPDIVMGCCDAAMLVATSTGQRVLTLPHALKLAEGGSPDKMHRLDLDYGDVCIFIKA